jgi:hypothetical protein
MDLPAFLIQPIQRLPRYELLLRELLKQTPKSHPEYTPLQDALMRIKETNAQINQLKRDEENQEKLRHIQAHLAADGGVAVPDLFDNPARLYVRSGDLNLKCFTRATPAADWKKAASSSKSNALRHCILFDDLLLITIKEKARPATRQLLQHVLRLDAVTINIFDSDGTISCTTKDGLSRFDLLTALKSEQSAWASLLTTLK